MKKKWNIDIDALRADDELARKLDKKWNVAHSHMLQRTHNHHMFSRVAHGMNLFEKARNDSFSEGTTQAMKRKIRAQTIQRVPDGEIVTQYDKNSIEQAEIEYLFKHKVLTSEYDGKDMMKNLWKTFNMSYDYGFGCVRTGFEKDLDGDPRISYTLIPYSDVFPSPDCKFIEEADWYIIREWIPRSYLRSLLEGKKGKCKDPTYVEDVVKYLVENEISSAGTPESIPLQDEKNGKTPTESIEIRTYYCRGASEFITYVPSIQCVLRKVKNYDPRKDVPLHFLILEPDPEFPLGCSSVLWTMQQQQFADAFQSTAYQTMLLALRPPLMTFGNLVNPKMKMKPGAIWPMGTNQNNRVEPFKVETTTLTQYGQLSEQIAAKMMQSLNITDATVASDANVAKYSATPQGVEQQKLDKTITVNQYQKRVEIFFQEWANHALRSYLNSMTGEIEITVDERTRRRIWDIEEARAKAAFMDPSATVPKSIVDGNKITIDFSALSSDLLSFEVRAGSLIENEKETERRNIQEMLIPVSQMMGNIGDQNRDAFERILMQLIGRLLELSDVDMPQMLAENINEKIMAQALKDTMDVVMGQQQQIGEMQQQLGMQPQMPVGQPIPEQGMPMPQQQPMPMPAEAQIPPEMMQEQPMPMPQEMPAEAVQMPPEGEVVV